DVHCLLPDDTATTAAAKMRSANVGFLPVCDDSRHVLGVLTDRDLVVRLVAMGKGGQTHVRDVMTAEVVACRPGDDLAVAEQLMSGYHKSRIVCTDDEGFICGVISLSDIAQVDDERRAGKTIRKITKREVHPGP